MKRQAFLRGLLGVPLGITMGHIITILSSLQWGQGYYCPCVPEFIDAMGNEINAVILQTILCGVIGAAFAAASVIWEIDSWNIAKQTGIYFFVTSLVMMPIAFIANWMEHSIMGFVIYFALFVAIFFAVWAVQYFIWKYKIKKMNTKLKKK